MSDPNKIIFAPQQVSAQAYQLIEERSQNPRVGVKTGISSVDAILNPHRPGELRVVLGYTSNYKSGFMNYIARNAARDIMRRNESDKRCVITVTWEQSVEEQGITDLAQLSVIDIGKMMRGELIQSEWSKLRKAAVERGGLPWWLIGHSSEDRERRPRMSMTDLAGGIATLVDVQGVTPELICLDYLQRIKREGDHDTRVQFMEIVDRCKDMALAFNVPVMLGSQSGRSVKSRKWQLPQLEDSQETSNLEQSADSLISLWMPKTSYPDGEIIEYGADKFCVDQNMLVCGVMKQKFGLAPKIIFLHVKPEINMIYDTKVKVLA
jgi:replicative DNA helicase